MAAPLGDAPGQKAEPAAVEPVGQAVVQGGVDAAVEQGDLQLAAGGGVAPLIGAQGFQ